MFRLNIFYIEKSTSVVGSSIALLLTNPNSTLDNPVKALQSVQSNLADKVTYLQKQIHKISSELSKLVAENSKLTKLNQINNIQRDGSVHQHQNGLIRRLGNNQHIDRNVQKLLMQLQILQAELQTSLDLRDAIESVLSEYFELIRLKNLELLLFAGVNLIVDSQYGASMTTKASASTSQGSGVIKDKRSPVAELMTFLGHANDSIPPDEDDLQLSSRT